MAEKTEKGREFLAGMHAGTPIVLGYIPVAVAYAVMARQAGFTAAETVAMSVAVYAGASQMMATEMYAQGAGISVIILAALIMNLRHVVMSTCVVSRLQKTRPAMRLLLAFGVVLAACVLSFGLTGVCLIFDLGRLPFVSLPAMPYWCGAILGVSLLALAVLGGAFGESVNLPGERLVGVAVVGVGMPQVCPEREALKTLGDKAGGDVNLFGKVLSAHLGTLSLGTDTPAEFHVGFFFHWYPPLVYVYIRSIAAIQRRKNELKNESIIVF